MHSHTSKKTNQLHTNSEEKIIIQPKLSLKKIIHLDSQSIDTQSIDTQNTNTPIHDSDPLNRCSSPPIQKQLLMSFNSQSTQIISDKLTNSEIFDEPSINENETISSTNSVNIPITESPFELDLRADINKLVDDQMINHTQNDYPKKFTHINRKLSGDVFITQINKSQREMDQEYLPDDSIISGPVNVSDTITKFDTEHDRWTTESKNKICEQQAFHSDFADIECNSCKKIKQIRCLIKQVDDIMISTNSTEDVDKMLSELTSYRQDIEIENVGSKTETICSVHRLVSHISYGGESQGVHFALFYIKSIDAPLSDLTNKDTLIEKNVPVRYYKFVTVKILPLPYGDHEKQIMRSFKYTGLRNDPLIVRHILTYELNKRAHIINEYIDGHNLEDLILSHPLRLTKEIKRAIVFDMYKGLRNLHRKGYLHLDVKPGNVLIREDIFDLHNLHNLQNIRSDQCSLLKLKIIDFGKSIRLFDNVEIHDEDDLLKSSSDIIIDKEIVKKVINNIFSTPVYMCPNVVIDEEYEKITTQNQIYCFGILCDLWSFAMTVYELYMGDAYYDKAQSGKVGMIMKHMMDDMKISHELNISDMMSKKAEIGIDDDLIKALSLCLIYRQYSDQIVHTTIDILEYLDKIFDITR